MAVWVEDGEKYAFIGLNVKFDGALPPEQVGSHLWVFADMTLEVPLEWREWLGSIRCEEITASNLFLVSKIASERPEILDAENQTLERHVWHFYIGLLLSAVFSPSHEPIFLTGVRRDHIVEIRQKKDLEVPVPQVFRPYPPLITDNILRAAQLGQNLDAMRPETVPGGLWRFFRILDIYVKARAAGDILDRIHQYCRCIDGIILPKIGKTKQQFKSRTELFIGPGHHDVMGEIFDVRSNVEHLHENQYLETFDRGVRIDLLKKEAMVEYIVRTALAGC